MIEQFFFDLRRIDVDAAADDHVFGAARDVEEPIFVATRQVAGVEPTCRVERFGGGAGIVPVAQADVWPAQAQFSNLIGCDLITLGIEELRLREHHWLTNRTGLALGILIAHGKAVHTDLSQPVALAKNQSALLVGTEKL